MASAAPTRVLVVAHRTAATRGCSTGRARARRPPPPSRCCDGPIGTRTPNRARPCSSWRSRCSTRRRLDMLKGRSATAIPLPPCSRRSKEAGSTRSSSPRFRRACRTGSAATSPTAWRRSACLSRSSPPSSPSAPSPTLVNQSHPSANSRHGADAPVEIMKRFEIALEHASDLRPAHVRVPPTLGDPDLQPRTAPAAAGHCRSKVSRRARPGTRAVRRVAGSGAR